MRKAGTQLSASRARTSSFWAELAVLFNCSLLRPEASCVASAMGLAMFFSKSLAACGDLQGAVLGF